MQFDYNKTLKIKYTKLVPHIYEVDSDEDKAVRDFNYDLLTDRIQNSDQNSTYNGIQSYLFLPFDDNRNWQQGLKVYSTIDDDLSFAKNSKIELEYLLGLDDSVLGKLLIESRVYNCIQIGDRTPDEYELDEHDNYIFELSKNLTDKEIIKKILFELDSILTSNTQ